MAEGSPSAPPGARNELAYRAPAADWLEALPIGNGQLGAMVFGGTGIERIQINEDTIWAGGPYRNDATGALAKLPKARELVFGGRWEEAQRLVDGEWTLDRAQGMPYQLAGWLEIDFGDLGEARGYRRTLDLSRGLATSRFEAAGTAHSRSAFASLVHPAIILRFEADGPRALDFTLRWKSPMPSASAHAAGNDLVLSGRGSEHEGVPGAVRFEARVRVIEHDGRLDASEEGRLRLGGATRATVAIAVATNFVDYSDVSADPSARVAKQLGLLEGFGYAGLLDRHSEAFRAWFERADIDLGRSERRGLPTDERIRLFSDGRDLEMAALCFQFGRYLLISSSQPGTQPANLQGVWNEELEPPWDCKYTTNVNLEMNYWPCLNGNLLELQEPLVRLIREVAETGRETARSMYGARGWVLHHNTDLWRITGPVDRAFPSYWAAWPSCGAWLCQHLWFQYCYSGDTAALAEAWPIIKSACEFFLDFLTEKPGTPYLVVCPSLSPENGHHDGVSVADGTTMDNAMVRELFALALKAVEILGIDDPLTSRIAEGATRLPPYRVGRWGQLQEWFEDWDRPEDDHRHISHLWGLYPSNQISERRTPALARAARVSLEARGDHSTGWATAWRMNCWARLGDGDRAWKLLKEFLKPANRGSKYNEDGGVYPNLLGAHAPFQIDGNFGCAAAIAELLIQSHDGDIHLLPALPREWPEGRARGLGARGGFTVDLEWSGGRLDKAVVHSRCGGNLRVRHASELAVEGGRPLPAAGPNPNPCFFVVPVPDQAVAAADRGFIRDIMTEAGQTVTLLRSREA